MPLSPRLSHNRIQAFNGDCRGTVAVEFAIVGSIFVTTLVAIFFLSILMYMNQALDYAVSKAARQVMTGAVQASALSQSSFRANVVCSYLPASFNCSNVTVNLQTLSEAQQPNGYYSLVNSTQTGLIIPTLPQYNTGVQASYEYLQLTYPVTFLPSYLAGLMGGTNYNGSPAILLMATIAFRNENY